MVSLFEQVYLQGTFEQLYVKWDNDFRFNLTKTYYLLCFDKGSIKQ